MEEGACPLIHVASGAAEELADHPTVPNRRSREEIADDDKKLPTSVTIIGDGNYQCTMWPPNIIFNGVQCAAWIAFWLIIVYLWAQTAECEASLSGGVPSTMTHSTAPTTTVATTTVANKSNDTAGTTVPPPPPVGDEPNDRHPCTALFSCVGTMLAGLLWYLVRLYKAEAVVLRISKCRRVLQVEDHPHFLLYRCWTRVTELPLSEARGLSIDDANGTIETLHRASCSVRRSLCVIRLHYCVGGGPRHLNRRKWDGTEYTDSMPLAHAVTWEAEEEQIRWAALFAECSGGGAMGMAAAPPLALHFVRRWWYPSPKREAVAMLLKSAPEGERPRLARRLDTLPE